MVAAFAALPEITQCEAATALAVATIQYSVEEALPDLVMESADLGKSNPQLPLPISHDRFNTNISIRSNYEDFSRDSFDDRRPGRETFDDRRQGMRGPSPTSLRYAPY